MRNLEKQKNSIRKISFFKALFIFCASTLIISCSQNEQRKLEFKSRLIQVKVAKVNDSLYDIFAVGGREHIFSKVNKTKVGRTNSIDQRKYFYFKLDSTELSIKTKNNEVDWEIGFKKGGVNEIFGISRYIFWKNNRSFGTNANTDFVGPLIFHQLDSPIEGNNKFTGGWHGSNGDGTGEATAKTIDWKVYTKDLKPIISDTVFHSTNNLFLEVNNLIKANNSEDYMLAENVLYEFHPFGVNVHIELTALGDLAIQRYHGIQSQNPWHLSTIEYHYEDNSTLKGGSREYNFSNDSINSNKVTHFRFINDTLPFHLSVWIDKSTKLYKGEQLAPHRSWAFTASYNKSYFNLVYGKALELSKGDKIEVRGGYYFVNNLIVN